MAIGLDIRVEDKDLKATYVVMKDDLYIETGTINHYLHWDDKPAHAKQVTEEIKMMLKHRFSMQIIMETK